MALFIEEGEQWLENVDQTHLVPASCNLVIQNIKWEISILFGIFKP